MKSLVYYCIADEVGAQESTPHSHAFVIYEHPKSFNTMKRLFPEAHIDTVKGTNSEVRDYVFKLGNWAESEKSVTKIPESQEEWGELPANRMCSKPELGILFELIKDGWSNYEILQAHPEYIKDITDIDRVRMILKQEEFKTTWRNLEVVYIFGASGTGKSRYVMEKYQYENVYRVTDYTHPFDSYFTQDVIMFEEFNSSIRIQDMLNYADGYPISLSARYCNKVACFTKVYFTTNIPLEQQYPNVQKEAPEVWKAFLRRINKVIHYVSATDIITYDSVADYYARDSEFVAITKQEELPFV